MIKYDSINLMFNELTSRDFIETGSVVFSRTCGTFGGFGRFGNFLDIGIAALLSQGNSIYTCHSAAVHFMISSSSRIDTAGSRAQQLIQDVNGPT